MFLLDTNVISQLAPTRSPTHRAAFEAWLRKADPHLRLSAITIAEIEQGIARAVRIQATARARRLRHWLDAVEALYGDRILPFGIEAARHAGTIMDRARAHQPGFADIAIAAIAEAHDLTVLTLNLRHFEPLGVRCLNPFEKLPA